MKASELMRYALQQIATGPTLSKDLTREETRDAMGLILDGNADEVQAGIFLIALRMKRETDDELAGVLDAISERTPTHELDVDHLYTIVDPYDGYLRSTPSAPFLPAVLAACGLPVLTHGVSAMGPKFGASHESVLAAAGVLVANTQQQAAKQLESAECGWAYASQTALSPKLSDLTDLRTRIVKRPCLTTIEVAINPYKPKVASHLVTGFVHKPYPPIYAKLAAEGGFASSIMVRGVEGGVVPSLTQASRYFKSVDGVELEQVELDPVELDIHQEQRATPLPDSLTDDSVRSVKAPGNPFAKSLSVHAAQLGLEALNGAHGYTRDSLVYAATVVLHAQGSVSSMQAGAEKVAAVLDDGSALKRFNAAAQS